MATKTKPIPLHILWMHRQKRQRWWEQESKKKKPAGLKVLTKEALIKRCKELEKVIAEFVYRSSRFEPDDRYQNRLRKVLGRRKDWRKDICNKKFEQICNEAHKAQKPKPDRRIEVSDDYGQTKTPMDH